LWYSLTMVYFRRYGKTGGGFARDVADVSVEKDLAERILRATQNETISPWEKTFLTSIGDQFKRKGILTVPQLGTFKKIELKLVSATASHSDFEAAFSPEQRRIYGLACEYYASTPYYPRVIGAYKNQLAEKTFDTYVPSEGDFRALTENPYFKKVLVALEAPAKFKKGDLVTVKKINKHGRNQDLYHETRTALVVKVNAKVPNSPAAGAKLYQIFLAPLDRDGVSGHDGLHLAEERFLRAIK
jgi:hypothetical protein